MNIVIVCDYIGDTSNGTTVAAFNLIHFLQDRGHCVKVLCCDEHYAGTPNYYIVPAINFHFLNDYVKKNGVQLASADKKVIEEALQDTDVVHIVMPFLLASVTAQMAKERHIAVTASFHCQAENVTSHLFLKNSQLASHITYQTLEKYIYKYADAIHYPTEFIRNTFLPYTKNNNAWVISNGVHPSFKPQTVERDQALAGKFIIASTGRFSNEKCHSVLIDAVKKSQYKDRIQLILAGSGPLKDTLVKQSADLPNAPIFHYFTREEMVTMLNSADLYVHPADIELEGISCLEAVSCGLTPIFSDSPKSATRLMALSDRNLFRTNDSTDLAQKIDWWIEHPEQRQENGKQYSLMAKSQYDFDYCMERMEEMLLSAWREKQEEPHGEVQEEIHEEA